MRHLQFRALVLISIILVASELMAGARTESARRLVESDLLGAFERRGCIVAPGAAAWAKTGVVLGRAATASISARTSSASAASCMSWSPG